jgi:glutathione S-transferase
MASGEKARWLDWSASRVRRSLLGLRMRACSGSRGRGRGAGPRRGHPRLDAHHRDARAAQPRPPLYPRDETARRRALALEEHFDEQLGPQLRRALFHDLLPHTDYAVAVLTTGCGAATRLGVRALFPLIRAGMRLDMRIDAAGAARGRAKILEALDRIEAELQPSGYLVGDGFSVADLTAAALLSPLVTPAEYPYPMPGPFPEPFATFRASLSGRRAFRWAEETYRRHRGTSSAVSD